MNLTNQDEDDAIAGAAATSVLAIGVAIIVAYKHQSSISREPYVNKDQEREFYMNSILNGSDVHCAHSNHDKFINKKNDIFDEMSLVCENDLSRGDCAKSFEGIDFEYFFEKDNDNDIEGPPTKKDAQVTEASQVNPSCKRKCSFEVQDVEVMAMEIYEKEFVGDAFDYFPQSITLAKAFMEKNQNLSERTGLEIDLLTLGMSDRGFVISLSYHSLSTRTYPIFVKVMESRMAKTYTTGYSLTLFMRKPKTKWPGLFIVTNVDPYGEIELEVYGNGRLSVNGQILKHYHMGGLVEA
ncbi:hypothetical protein FXO38_26938 [Capsicum annuum]|uniref:Uncharacterized protein n=1 Tax=Capsicum annuum TaxID=4072 RepID=A0A2G2YWD3_CAPAN|nr:hypothetical protein FXO38_26938 [Capsicum annuum]KAF3654801.1 hypothetical protein FXO37_16293 [Capsicum annuum]PHT74049.1 hypothetical protein T459_21326 [Capsicum annuum]